MSQESKGSKKGERRKNILNAANGPVVKNARDASILDKMKKLGAKVVISIAEVYL